MWKKKQLAKTQRNEATYGDNHSPAEGRLGLARSETKGRNHRPAESRLWLAVGRACRRLLLPHEGFRFDIDQDTHHSLTLWQMVLYVNGDLEETSMERQLVSN